MGMPRVHVWWSRQPALQGQRQRSVMSMEDGQQSRHKLVLLSLGILARRARASKVIAQAKKKAYGQPEI